MKYDHLKKLTRLLSSLIGRDRECRAFNKSRINPREVARLSLIVCASYERRNEEKVLIHENHCRKKGRLDSRVLRRIPSRSSTFVRGKSPSLNVFLFSMYSRVFTH